MFRTELSIAPATDQLARTARVLTMGSCFAESIGTRLAANKVEALVNPFGTVFQPLALGRLLRAAAGEEVDWQQHVVEARGRWQSYDLHGSIGAESPVELLQTIQELVRRTGEFLRSADVVLLTLGTAWAYRLRETGELVSNCHKQPADLFVRELLTPDEIINGLAETHAYLRRINPALRFVLTVSPVRHLKETLPLNSVSKSVLRVATHYVSDLLPGVAYFPAYELLTDDLRDYRFYASDMLHPSAVAEDYIWDKFTRTYFDAEFGRFRKEWASVRQSLEHRPLHVGAPEHRQFLESTLAKLEQLSLRKVAVASELQTVRTQLDALPAPRLPEPPVEEEDDEERIDIGDAASSPGVDKDARSADALPKLEERPARLSPEEFRSQRASQPGRTERGRRDGRGKGKPALAGENEQFQTAASVDSSLELPMAAPVAALAPEPATVSAGTQLVPGAGSEEPEKKKKRRSRGGAKRTARKHALRLAAEMGDGGDVDGTPTPPATPDAAATSASQPEGRKPSVIAKSVPVKRGGRRNEGGRVPRVELFAAAPPEPTSAGTSLQQDAEMPNLVQPQPITAISEVLATPDTTANTAGSAPRGSRNRNRRGETQGKTDGTATMPAPDAATSQAIGTAAELSGTPIITPPPGSRSGRRKPSTAAPEAAATPAPALPTAPDSAPIAAAAPARKSNRAKRVVSGARTEKPAVDTPVVPVPDASQVRTQVAAGRMQGTSASLVEPETAAKKPVAARKPAAVKSTAAAKKTSAPKVTAAKPVPAPPAEAAPPARKPKPAAKAKAAPANTPAAPPKAPRKPKKSS